MKRKVGLILAWAAATVATSLIALTVVRLADSRVGEDAVFPLSAQEIESLDTNLPPATAGTPNPTTSTAGTLVAPADTAARSTTTSTVSEASEAPPATSPASSTTIAAATSTTTTAPTPAEGTGEEPADGGTTTPQEPTVSSYSILGGSVVVRWTSDRIELVSATPNDGFRVSIEDAGPEQVVVEFEGDEEGSKFVAKVENGEISVKTEIED